MVDTKLVERLKMAAKTLSKWEGWCEEAGVIEDAITALEEAEAKAGPTREEIEDAMFDAMMEKPEGATWALLESIRRVSRLFPTAPVDEESER